MNKDERINASITPTPPVFPPVGSPAKAHRLGVVMLDTQFPRPPGDVGHPDTWGVPIDRRVVRGIWPDKVVQSAAGLRAGRVVPSFQAIVRLLHKQLGVSAITTSCGFLALLQRELQSVVKIPVVTSSLLQLPALLREEQAVGVLTISAGSLGDEHLRLSGVPRERLKDVLIEGVNPKGEFASAILGNRPEMDLEKAAGDVVAAAVALKARAPQLRTLVLECTNMPPYKALIEQATGLRVLSLVDSPVLRKALGLDDIAKEPS